MTSTAVDDYSSVRKYVSASAQFCRLQRSFTACFTQTDSCTPVAVATETNTNRGGELCRCANDLSGTRVSARNALCL